MKLLIASPMYPPEIGDGALYIKTLAGLLSQKHTVSLSLYGDSYEDIPDLQTSITRKSLPLSLRLPLFTWKLLGASRRVEMIISLGAGAAGLPSVIAGKLRGIPVVLIMRNNDERWGFAVRKGLSQDDVRAYYQKRLFGRLQFHIQRMVLRNTDTILCSKEIAEVFQEVHHLAKEKFNIIDEPIDLIHVHSIPIPAMTLAMYFPIRSTDLNITTTVFAALDEISQTTPDIKLVISCDLPEQQEVGVSDAIQRLSIQQSVIFRGRISRPEEEFLVADCAGILLSSLSPERSAFRALAHCFGSSVVEISPTDTAHDVAKKMAMLWKTPRNTHVSQKEARDRARELQQAHVHTISELIESQYAKR